MIYRGRAGVTGLAGALAMCLLLTACTISIANPFQTGNPTPSSTSGPAGVPTAEELARAVVLISALDESGSAICQGSGTFIDSAATILTNFHVIADVPPCDYADLGVSITTSADQAPELRYLADAYAVAPELDLAVIRLRSQLDGSDVEDSMPYLKVGDSDSVKFGDDLQLIGYPGIGGSTVTLTAGKVSGFGSEPNIGGRAWIKTDGTIAGGNSGGLAANSAGELVAVPTQASSGDNEQVTDCRRVQDTNNDGTVDEADSCVPIGGFVNALRPVNLAAAVIEQAAGAQPIPTDELTWERGDPDALAPEIDQIEFAADVDGDEPVGASDYLPSGSAKICAFFSFDGMVDGVEWDAIWSFDGTPQQESVARQPWRGGTSGDWWSCFQAGDGETLADGLWELAVFVGDGEDPVRRGNVYLGDTHAPVEIDVSNDLDEIVCTLNLSPDPANSWGMDRLGEYQLDPGYHISLTLPAGTYDLRAVDCDDTELITVDSVAVEEGAAIVLEH